MKQREIILVPFPFSDQSGQKIRPAIIVSNDRFNDSCNDVIACAITSNLKPSTYTLLIDQNDLGSGVLYEKSAIKMESIFKIKKDLVLKTIATMKQSSFLKVVKRLSELFAE